MTINVQYFARCDECEAEFEDSVDYELLEDLVHDVDVAGWETDGETHRCARCVRAEIEDRPYAGPPIHSQQFFPN